MSETAKTAAATRYRWMFRVAAVVYLFFGAALIWRYGFTDYHPENKLIGLAIGGFVLGVGAFLWPLRRLAIGLSAAPAAFVGISAAVFAPNAVGGVRILALAALALVCVLYAALAARVALAHSDGR